MVKDFEFKPIKRGGKPPNQHLKSILTMRMHIQIAYQFTTTSTSFNLYITCTVNNLMLINTLTNKKKDWIKEHIRGIETMADIQLQLQNIIKLAEVANIQLAKIKITILQASNIYKIQMVEDIFSILEDLQNII